MLKNLILLIFLLGIGACGLFHRDQLVPPPVTWEEMQEMEEKAEEETP